VTAQPLPPPVADGDFPHLTDEEILLLDDDEYQLYIRLLEAEALERRDEPYQLDPVGWVHDVLDEFLWSKQQEVMRAVVDHRRVAVRSCHGVGKTYSMARLVAWWLSVHPPGEAFVVSSAPSFPQVRALLWREINNAHAKGNLPGRTNQTEWWIGGQLVGYGRKPADAGSFVGLHAKRVLVILDEGDGIPQELFDAANALATNETSRIVTIGNPDTAGSAFHKVCRTGSGWHVIGINAFESPNFTGEYVPQHVRDVLIGQTYVEEVRRDHGEDSPIYRSKILGEFPEQNTTSVVPIRAIDRAREARPMPAEDLQPVELGVDVAAGGDQSVIRVRRGPRITDERWASRHDDPERLVEEIMEAQALTHATSIKVDGNGVGWGIAGSVRRRLEAVVLRRVGQPCAVHAVQVGQGSSQPKRFKNLRAELWWTARELCEDQVLDLSLLAPEDPLLEELGEPRYSTDAAGRILVEKKDDVRKRLGRSPDDADAGLLAIYVPPILTQQVVPQGRWSHIPGRR
jgi:hypothetical protein